MEDTINNTLEPQFVSFVLTQVTVHPPTHIYALLSLNVFMPISMMSLRIHIELESC